MGGFSSTHDSTAVQPNSGPSKPQVITNWPNLPADRNGTELLGQVAYDVAPDGRFLVNTAIAQTTVTPITLVMNWKALIGQ